MRARCPRSQDASRKTWLNRRDDGVSRNPAPEFFDVRRRDVTMTDMTRRMQRDPHIPTRAGRMLASRAPTRFAALAIMLSVWVSVTAQSAALPDDDYAALARAVIDRVVIPAWAEHARAAQGLAPAIERHCTGSAEADAVAVRAAFDGVMDAWQRASPPPRARGRSPAVERCGFQSRREGEGARSARKPPYRACARDRSALAGHRDPRRIQLAGRRLMAIPRGTSLRAACSAAGPCSFSTGSATGLHLRDAGGPR